MNTNFNEAFIYKINEIREKELCEATEATENDNARAMLQMIDPSHSIMLDDKIGLLGVSNDSQAINDKVANIKDLKNENFIRGEYFSVVGEDGCLLFEPYVISCGSINDGEKLVGYCFILKDYKVKDELGSFFDSGLTKEAIIVYADNKLITNISEEDNKIYNVKTDKNIDINTIGNGTYVLTLNNDNYVSTVINIKHKILRFTKINKEIKR